MDIMLRSFELEDIDLDPNNPWHKFLQAPVFGIRSNYLPYDLANLTWKIIL
jgi:hypothetical protein